GGLGDGGGCAGGGGADHQEHRGHLGAVGGGAPAGGHTPVQLRIDQCEQLLTEDLAHGGDVVGAAHLDTPAEVVHEHIGGVGAQVRQQQRLLDLVPAVLVNAAAAEQVQDAEADGAGA